MRLIIRNRQSVSTWSVRDHIKQTQANLYRQQTTKYVTMQNIFRKLYLKHLEDHEKLEVLRRDLTNRVLMAPTPALAIAQYFHAKAKSYSQDFLTATVSSIAAAYQISKSDNGVSVDSKGYQLFMTSQFTNLSEQIKFAIRNNKLNFANLVSVIESLIKLEYVDNEIINLLLLYTQREINDEDPSSILKNWKGDREYQIEKKSYYDPAEFDTLKTVRNSIELTTALSFVKHIYRESESEKSLQREAEGQSVSIIQDLIEQISETNKNFRQIVEGIINIRREYLKMVEFSENEQILRNPSLNLELLDLQEKLLAIKLINIQDIRNPANMKDSNYEIKRVEETILSVLNIDNLNPIAELIDHSSVEVINEKDEFNANPSKVATLLNLLAKFANLDRFVYYAADGRSLLTLKWEKTLIDQQPGMQITTGPLHEQLNVSRIYRRVFSDVVQLFNKNQEKLTKIFADAHIQHKIELYDAYCRVGLNQFAILNIHELESLTQPEQLVSTLSTTAFSNFVHLLNDIGIFVANPTLKEVVYNRLIQDLVKEESNILNLPLRTTMDTVNYLIQNHRDNEGFQNIYDRYIHLLELKAGYLTVQTHENELSVEAFKILALERPDKYATHPTYLGFVNGLINSEYKKNPYLSVLRETCFKWANKEHALNSFQTYLNIGVSNGIQNGLIFSNSDQTSLDGQIRSGDLNSYIIRLENQTGMKIHEFSINSFLNINFESRNERQFQLKPVEDLKERLDEVFERQVTAFEGTYERLKESLTNLFEFYPSSLITNRIIFKIAVIDKLLNNNINIETKEQEFTNKAEFLLEALELNKLINVLKQDKIYSTVPRKEPLSFSINEKLNKNESFNDEGDRSDTITVDVQAMKALLKQIKNTTLDLINQISVYVSSESLQKAVEPSNTSLKLKGQRQTLEVLNQEEKVTFDLSTQFINYRYYNDKTYCEYKDWKDRITKKYNLVELNYDSLSNLSKVLTNKFCSGLSNKVTLMPVIKHEERIKRLNLEFKLLKEEPSETKAVQHTDKKEKKQDEELDYIINLQNFKHELKSTFSPQNLLNYIFGFKFVNNLLPRSDDKVKLLLHRNPEEYFNYLEELSEKTYIESPFVKYIIEKLSKTDKVRNLLQKRKDVRINQRILYQKGEITSQIYYSRIGQVQDEIIAALTDLKEKMLDDMKDALLPGEFKMIQIKKEEFEAFQQIILHSFGYSRHFDEDFISADGKYEVALNLKRGRAQNNFIKFSLLKKVLEKNELNSNEKDLMRKWHEDITKNVGHFVPHTEFTTLQISDLSWEDLQHLKLKSSTLSSNKNMLLIDLILELNNFLDESLIYTYEREVKASYIEKTFKVPAFLFTKTSGNSFKQLENETEAAILNEKSQLTEADLNTMEEMFKYYKTQGLKERNRYSVLCNKFRENLQQMNKQSTRNELIEEYVKHLEYEFLKEYNPVLVKDIKDKETDKLWREVFRQPYESCSKQLLKECTKKLIIRLEIVGDNAPPFLGNLLLNLLQHPNLDSLSKESLIAAIEATKFDLNLDSLDIEQISKREGRQTRQALVVKNDLKAACSRKIGKQLKERIQSLL